MKYCEDSTVEKLERGYVCKTQGHVAVRMCDPVRESATRDARVRRGARGRDVVRESAMRDARVRRGTREHTYVR